MRATTSQMSRNGPEGGMRRGPGRDGTATLERLELLEVPAVVSRGLLHRVPAELLQEGLRQDQRRHRLADDPAPEAAPPPAPMAIALIDGIEHSAAAKRALSRRSQWRWLPRPGGTPRATT